MNHIFTIYSLFFFATTLVSFFVAILAWQRRSVVGAKELTLLMIAAGFWAFWIIFETAAHTVVWKIFWSKLEYIGAVTTPVLFLVFVLRFTGKGKFISTKYILPLFIIPAITLAFAFTNERHYLVWSGFSPISETTNIMQYYHGVWFWIGFLAYNNILFILSTFNLIDFITHHQKAFRTQGLIIFVAGLCPWIASIIYLTKTNLAPGIDLTPVSIILSGTLLGFAILYTRFLNLIPIARETLVEILPDGILALDGQNRIQDINDAALRFLGIQNKNIIGTPAESSGASVTQLLNAVLDPKPVDQIDIQVSNETKNFRITKQAIKNHPESRLVVIHDITDSKKAEETVRKNEEEIRLLISNIRDVVYSVDMDTKEFKYLSPSFERITGFSIQDIKEMGGRVAFLNKVVTVAKLKEWDNILLQLNESELDNDYKYETWWLCKDGSYKFLQDHWIPIYLNGKLVSTDGVLIDITERKMAEEALQNSEERFRQLAEIFPEIIFECDLQGNLTYTNEKGNKKLGYSADDVAKGINIIELIVPEDRERVMSQIQKRIEKVSGNYTEYRPLCKDGSSFHAIAFSAPIIQNHKVVGLRGFILDITERKKFEEKLKESEKRYRTLFETSPSGIILLDEHGIVLEANDIIAKNTLYTQEELIGSDVRMFVSSDKGYLVDENIKRILAGETLAQEVVNQRKDGTFCIFSLRESAVMLPNGQRGILSVSNDITERKLAEKRLQESEERFKDLAELMPQPIWETDLEANFTYTNRAGKELFGYNLADLENGLNILALIAPEDRKRIFENFSKKLQGNQVEDHEYLGLKKDGTKFPLLVYSTPIIKNGILTGVRGISLDITEIKQAETEIRLINKELSKINSEKDKFFSIIAHDLKSPFNAIVGFSEILAEQVKVKDFDGIEEYSKIIVQSSHRAMDLLINLMEWSRSQTGRMNYNPVHFELTNLIDEIVLLFNDVAGQKSITIAMNLLATENIYADRAMISTILRNLISNAIKFTPERGRVTISTKRIENNTIGVSISDTGIGMNPNLIGNLFRLDVNTSRPSTDGELSTGLGLHLCKEFVSKHGGKIWVESEEGKGSVFYFTIPDNAEMVAR
jgi:PAS domain S-box-containing protein